METTKLHIATKILELEAEILSLKKEYALDNIDSLPINVENFFNISKDLHCIANLEGYFLKVNPQWLITFDYTEKELLSTPFLKFVHPDDVEKTISEMKRLKSGETTFVFENRFIKKNGEFVYLSWNVFPDMTTNLLYANARDITIQKHIEKELDRKNNVFRTAQKIAKIGTWEFDLTNEKLNWSDELFEIFELQQNPDENLAPTYFSMMDAKDAQELNFCFERCKTEKEPYKYEHDILLSEGRKKTLFCLGMPELNHKHEVVKIYGIAQDITESKIKNQKLESNLQEKEVLLKEVHHRVKNNLQIISSLLNLQSGFIENNEFKSIFQESRDRIKSIASVHELLYQSDTYESISFEKYLGKLLLDLNHSYFGEEPKVKLFVNSQFNFNIDTSVPLGLLINEIASNSFKHGLSNQNYDFFYVNVHQLKDSKYILKIGDNGKGFENRKTKKETLGTLLISELATQLNGEIKKLEKNSGTHYELEFTCN